MFPEKALTHFRKPPVMHNCAQAVAYGCGHDELIAGLTLETSAGGNAPGGLCGAVYAAMLCCPEDEREAIRSAFEHKLGSSLCRALKRELGVPCPTCVQTAASIVEEKVVKS